MFAELALVALTALHFGRSIATPSDLEVQGDVLAFINTSNLNFIRAGKTKGEFLHRREDIFKMFL